MMADAAAELKRVEKKKKRQTAKKAKADQQKRRCRIESSDTDTDTDTATRASDVNSVDKDGFDTDEESYSKEQPFDYERDAAMEQD